MHRGGMRIPETSSMVTYTQTRSEIERLFDVEDYFGGLSKWEANSSRMIKDKDGNLVSSPREPFYDTYEKYAEYTRLVGKDYSIVPEHISSNHVELIESGRLEESKNVMLEISGGLSGSVLSSATDFYKVYSNSDFMKHFQMIKEDHQDFVEAAGVTLKCNAIKKFLPYDGFYPAQRCLDLGKQFYKSYHENNIFYLNN